MREKCTNKGKREAKIEAKPDRGATVTPERKVREEIFPLIKRDTDIKDMSNVTYKHESGGNCPQRGSNLAPQTGWITKV